VTIEIEQKVLQSIADARADLASKETNWLASKATLIPVLEKLSALGAEPYMLYSDSMMASITGDVHQLTDAIRALRTGGYKADIKPERKSSSFCARYAHKTSNVGIYLNFSSSVCRRVKVGTKTETVDVYEVRCGESEEFQAEPAKGIDVPF
jgi:hypothetical protein